MDIFLFLALMTISFLLLKIAAIKDELEESRKFSSTWKLKAKQYRKDTGNFIGKLNGVGVEFRADRLNWTMRNRLAEFWRHKAHLWKIKATFYRKWMVNVAGDQYSLINVLREKKAFDKAVEELEAK